MIKGTDFRKPEATSISELRGGVVEVGGMGSHDLVQWLITMVNVNPLRMGLWDPFQNDLFMAYKWGVFIPLTSPGMILQV